MRCPKCHYLSFEPDPRCKNCGYDLDVETEEAEEVAELPDLPLRPVATDAAHERVVTLELVKPVVPPPVPALQPVRQPEPEPARVFEPARVPEPALALAGVAAEPAARRSPGRPSPPTTELPLFVKTMGPQELGAFDGQTDEAAVEPVVQLPPSSRPLSVRRPVAEPARSAQRHERRPGPLDHDLLEDLQRLEREEAIRGQKRLTVADALLIASEDDGAEVAMSQRLGAAAFDGLLLGGIGAFVLWATLKVLDASPADLGTAALLPMGVFLAAVCIAYLLMFTAAGGQTVGKMLTGIRVIGDGGPEGERVTIGQAAGRAILAPLSIAVLGLGWLPALIGRGPALHDRLAHTRVVRA